MMNITQHGSPIPSGSTHAALHSSWVSNLLRLPSQPPHQNRVQPPYSMSKNHLTVKLPHKPRSFSRPHTSAHEERKLSYLSLFTIYKLVVICKRKQTMLTLCICSQCLMHRVFDCGDTFEWKKSIKWTFSNCAQISPMWKLFIQISQFFSQVSQLFIEIPQLNFQIFQ